MRTSYVFLLTLAVAASLQAEPSFARKYKVDCSFCHTVYPRLNRTGYEFRRLGYRFPRDVQQTLSQQNVVPAASSAPGAALYENLHCASCHSIQGQGANVGPALDGISTRRSPDYLAAQITNPRDHNPATIMPAFSLSPEQTKQLVEYLDSLPSTESAHKFKPLDYLGYTWVPAIRLNQSEGTTNANYDTRSMFIFAAGTLGDHLSMFVESNPAATGAGLTNYLGVAQGLYNTGGTQNYFQFRGGQVLELQGSGFGTTDRFFSDSLPLIYFPINGFAAGRYGQGGSAEYTLGPSTTFKAFGEEETDGSRAFGGIWEQIIGTKGLSGVSVEYAGGWNTNFQSPTGRELHFSRLYLGGNKTFQDRQGRQRLNLMGAFSFIDDNQYIGLSSNQPSHGYGSFIEADVFPVFRHVTTYFRFDQLRPTTQTNTSFKAGTAGVIFDFTRYTRLLLEYQRFTSGVPSNFYTIGFRLNL